MGKSSIEWPEGPDVGAMGGEWDGCPDAAEAGAGTPPSPGVSGVLGGPAGEAVRARGKVSARPSRPQSGGKTEHSASARRGVGTGPEDARAS